MNTLFQVVPINVKGGEKTYLCFCREDKHALFNAGVDNLLGRLFGFNAEHKTETADLFNTLCALKLGDNICGFFLNLAEKLVINSLDYVACSCTANGVSAEG